MKTITRLGLGKLFTMKKAAILTFTYVSFLPLLLFQIILYFF